MKITILVLSFFVILVLPSCSFQNVNDEGIGSSYTVTSCAYSDVNESINKNININYPQISELYDKDIEQKINDRIKELAFAEFDLMMSLPDGEEQLAAEWTIITTAYEVTLADADILSISFEMSSYVKWQTYPRNSNKSLTINIKTGEELKLRDIVDISDDFINSFFDNFRITIDSEEYSDDVISSINDDSKKYYVTYEYLNSCDEQVNVDMHSFLKEDCLVISISVAHVIGSYVWYEARYENIEEFLNPEFLDLINK